MEFSRDDLVVSVKGSYSTIMPCTCRLLLGLCCRRFQVSILLVNCAEFSMYSRIQDKGFVFYFEVVSNIPFYRGFF